MTRQIRWKRGLLRVWLIAACAWAGFVVYTSRSEIAYSWEYSEHMDHLREQALGSYLKDCARNSPKPQTYKQKPTFDAPVGNEYDAIANQMAEEDRAKMACDQQLSKEQRQMIMNSVRTPDFGWIAAAIFPPTIGVSLMLLLALACYRVGKWVLAGFSSGQ
ncbi:MAG TPA: hypothetical protein VKC56_12790 [Gallionellaceae bacterium]|nr:hypothetical protein [Gallionellaceae bacterium]